MPQGDLVHEVRSAADIARLISDYVALKPAGRKLKGLCPFHNEKTPSFTVDPEKQLFFCFGCRTGGDTFKFYMLMERLEFGDALRQLAARFGIAVPKWRGGDGGATSRLLEMHREASAFFRRELAGPRGGAARAYLQQRGLGAETVARLGIGFAPEGWDNLRNHLKTAGYREEEMVDAGLAARSKRGSGCYDWFRNRITFPIERVGGGLIGFGGRVLGDDEPKYLNSPETAIFSKGRHLYGLAWSRDDVVAQGTAIIVEGYMDFAALWEKGVRHVVAVLGTGFTPEHGRLLGRFTRQAVINFDADTAGHQAAERALEVLVDQEFDVRVLELPEGLDPDDLVRRQGAEAYLQEIAGALPFVDHLLEVACRGKDLSRPEDKARAASEILPRLAPLKNRVLRAAALGRTADRLNLPEEAVRAEFHRLGASGVEKAPPRQPARQPRRGSAAERQLLRQLLDRAEARRGILDTAREEDFVGLATQPLFAAIMGQHRAGLEISVAALETILPGEERQELLEIALEDLPDAGPGSWMDCWRTLSKDRLVRESHALQRQLLQGMEEAEGAVHLDDLLRRKLELRRKIDALT